MAINIETVGICKKYIDQAVNNTSGTNGAKIDDDVVTPNSTWSSEKIATADADLQKQIGSVSQNAPLGNKISDQINQLEYDKAEQSSLTTEITARKNADAELQGQIDDNTKIHLNESSNIGNEIYEKAILTIVDDDGSLEFFNDFVPLYEARDVRCSFAVVASRADTPIGTTTSGDPYTAMSWSQIKNIVGNGFDLMSHTYSHDRTVFNTGDNLDETHLEIQYGDADKLFRKNGLDYNCIVYPWGTAQSIKKRIAKRYAKFGLSLISGDTGLITEVNDPMAIPRYTVSSSTGGLEGVKTQIDTAIANKQWLILCTHANNGLPSVETMGDILDYAIEKGIRIETFTKAARLKAPVYYTGEGDTMFRVMPNGITMCHLDDKSVTYLINRATSLGLIDNAEVSISASYNNAQNIVGNTVDTEKIVVTVEYRDGTSDTTTDFSITETNLVLVEGDNIYHIVHNGLNCILTIDAINQSDAASITLQPTDVVGESGETVELTINAIGKGLTYNWQWLSTQEDTNKWLNTGTTSNTLSIVCDDFRNLRKYRCIVSSTLGEVLTSDTATLHIGSQYQTLVCHTSNADIERNWMDNPLKANTRYHFRVTVERREYNCNILMKLASDNTTDNSGTQFITIPADTFHPSREGTTFECEFITTSITPYLYLYNKGVTLGKSFTIEYFELPAVELEYTDFTTLTSTGISTSNTQRVYKEIGLAAGTYVFKVTMSQIPSTQTNNVFSVRRADSASAYGDVLFEINGGSVTSDTLTQTYTATLTTDSPYLYLYFAFYPEGSTLTLSYAKVD